MKFFGVLLALVLAGLTSLSAAESSRFARVPELSAATATYKKALLEIENNLVLRSAKATKDYADVLEKMRKEFRPSSNPDEVAAVKAEQQRILKKEETGAGTKTEMDGKLLGARQAYDREREPFTKMAAEEKAAALAKYIAELKAIQDRFAKLNRTENVELLKEFREAIEQTGVGPEDSHPPMSSAPFSDLKLDAGLAKAIRTALDTKTTKKTVQSKNSKSTSADIPKEGAILIGFEVEEAVKGTFIVKTLRPIFLSEKGTFFGAFRGHKANKVFTVCAKPGFSVSGVNVYHVAEIGLHSVQVIFSQYDAATGKFVSGPTSSYNSKWYGTKQSKGEIEVRSGGGVAVGIFGQTGWDTDTVGFVTLP